MATLGDFSSVFEVGFAVNGLLQYLEIDPAHRSRLHLLVEAIDDLTRQCKEKGVARPPVSGDISTEWAFQWIRRMQRQFWQRLTLLMSIVALGLLVWGAYSPTTMFPWWLSVPLVIALFIVPLKAYVSCRQIEHALENNVFETADALGVDAKAFFSSKGIIPTRPTDLWNQTVPNHHMHRSGRRVRFSEIHVAGGRPVMWVVILAQRRKVC